MRRRRRRGANRLELGQQGGQGAVHRMKHQALRCRVAGRRHALLSAGDSGLVLSKVGKRMQLRCLLPEQHGQGDQQVAQGAPHGLARNFRVYGLTGTASVNR